MSIVKHDIVISTRQYRHIYSDDIALEYVAFTSYVTKCDNEIRHYVLVITLNIVKCTKYDDMSCLFNLSDGIYY